MILLVSYFGRWPFCAIGINTTSIWAPKGQILPTLAQHMPKSAQHGAMVATWGLTFAEHMPSCGHWPRLPQHGPNIRQDPMAGPKITALLPKCSMPTHTHIHTHAHTHTHTHTYPLLSFPTSSSALCIPRWGPSCEAWRKSLHPPSGRSECKTRIWHMRLLTKSNLAVRIQPQAHLV